jgi:hypothetical protein
MQRHYLEQYIIPPIVSIVELYLNDWVSERRYVMNQLKFRADRHNRSKRRQHIDIIHSLLPDKNDSDSDSPLHCWMIEETEDRIRSTDDPNGYIRIRPLLMSQIRYNARKRI